MSEFIVFDTSVLVDHLRTARHRQQMEALRGVVRNCAVVLAELLRGVATPRDHEVIRELAKNHPILSPTQRNWQESGELLAKIQAHRGFPPNKLRDLHFDVLIALTARSHGARLITSNRVDFELIHSYRKFQLEIW